MQGLKYFQKFKDTSGKPFWAIPGITSQGSETLVCFSAIDVLRWIDTIIREWTVLPLLRLLVTCFDLGCSCLAVLSVTASCTEMNRLGLTSWLELDAYKATFEDYAETFKEYFWEL